jgi:hypothetical protein
MTDGGDQTSAKPLMPNRAVSESEPGERGGVSAVMGDHSGNSQRMQGYGLVKGAIVEIRAPTGGQGRIERRVMCRPHPGRDQ